VASRSNRKQKPHVQQQLFKTHGGKREGAGRKPKGFRAGAPHKKRPTLKSRHPVHVVLRVVREIGSLRRRAMYKALRAASLTAALREDFRIVHISIQRTHVHMLVEADHKGALARGMQGFQISAAKQLNAAVSVTWSERRRGQVFADRYHSECIDTPRRARHALAYVLNNWRKHREDQAGLARSWKVDPFSSAITFPDWKELEDSPVLWKMRDTYDPLVVYRPTTWLLREGWKRHGFISVHEVPSARAPRRARSAPIAGR
jgi:REP element-mobilizing transposase RayT